MFIIQKLVGLRRFKLLALMINREYDMLKQFINFYFICYLYRTSYSNISDRQIMKTTAYRLVAIHRNTSAAKVTNSSLCSTSHNYQIVRCRVASTDMQPHCQVNSHQNKQLLQRDGKKSASFFSFLTKNSQVILRIQTYFNSVI